MFSCGLEYLVLGSGCTLHIKLSFQLFSVMFSQIDVAVLLDFASYALFENLLPDILPSSLNCASFVSISVRANMENRVYD